MTQQLSATESNGRLELKPLLASGHPMTAALEDVWTETVTKFTRFLIRRFRNDRKTTALVYKACRYRNNKIKRWFSPGENFLEFKENRCNGKPSAYRTHPLYSLDGVVWVGCTVRFPTMLMLKRMQAYIRSVRQNRFSKYWKQPANYVYYP